MLMKSTTSKEAIGHPHGSGVPFLIPGLEDVCSSISSFSMDEVLHIIYLLQTTVAP